MRATLGVGMVLAIGLSVSACGGKVEEEEGGGAIGIGTLFGEESTQERELREAQEARLRNQVPVTAVRSVELGRTRDGFLITALGTAPGLGYALPTLRPRRSGQPGADGFIEYDFVAVAPDAGFALPQGTSQTRAMRADLAVSINELRGASGIRVIAQTGGVQVDF